MTGARSFEKMKGWVEEVQTCISKEVPLWIVGNKVDASYLRQVPSEEGKSYCASQGGFFRELSAWDNKGVVELFTSLGESLPLAKLPAHNNQPSEQGKDD